MPAAPAPAARCPSPQPPACGWGCSARCEDIFMPVTIFDSGTIPRDRRVVLESTVVAAGRHLSKLFEGSIAATPDRRKFAMRITSYPAVDISVPFEWSRDCGEGDRAGARGDGRLTRVGFAGRGVRAMRLERPPTSRSAETPRSSSSCSPACTEEDTPFPARPLAPKGRGGVEHWGHFGYNFEVALRSRYQPELCGHADEGVRPTN